MAPKVSVVMPTYQRPHFLAQALDTLVRQTMGDFEALIGDNAADPATEEVIRRHDDRRLRYFPRPQNVGMLRNVLLAVGEARSPFVMKLDDDDLLYPDSLARLVNPLEKNPDVTLSFGHVVPVDEEAVALPTVQERLDHGSGRSWLPEGLIRPATWLVAQGGVQLAGAVLRKDCVNWDTMPEDVATAYDLHLALSAAQSERAFWFTRAPVVKYRIHAASDTHRQSGKQALGAVVALEAALTSGRHGDVPALERRLANATIDAARGKLLAGEVRAARALARRSLQLHPSVQAGRLLALSAAPPLVAAWVSRHRAAQAARSKPYSPGQQVARFVPFP